MFSSILTMEVTIILLKLKQERDLRTFLMLNTELHLTYLKEVTLSSDTYLLISISRKELKTPQLKDNFSSTTKEGKLDRLWSMVRESQTQLYLLTIESMCQQHYRKKELTRSRSTLKANLLRTVKAFTGLKTQMTRSMYSLTLSLPIVICGSLASISPISRHPREWWSTLLQIGKLELTVR